MQNQRGGSRLGSWILHSAFIILHFRPAFPIALPSRSARVRRVRSEPAGPIKVTPKGGPSERKPAGGGAGGGGGGVEEVGGGARVGVRLVGARSAWPVVVSGRV